MRADHKRTKIVTTRWSEHEYRLLVKLAARSGARTPSGYLRARAITGQNFHMPPFETLRDMRNELIKLRLAVGAAGKVSRNLEDACIAAMERISRF